MPRSYANRSAWPGVGEATATTSAPATRRSASAWIAVMNPEPTSPTRTVSIALRPSARPGFGRGLLLGLRGGLLRRGLLRRRGLPPLGGLPVPAGRLLRRGGGPDARRGQAPGGGGHRLQV